MNVETILRNKGSAVATIAPHATVRDAAAVLRRERIGALVVSGDHTRVDGILSERDIVHGLADRGAALLDMTVDALATSWR
jgi:CBS domain-containing protein